MPSRLIHVLGGGHWQLPTIRIAKRLGLRVLVTDMYEERPAYTIADLHELASIADPEATLEVAKRHRIDAIICDTTDVGVPTAAFVAEQLGLPGIGVTTARNFTRKDMMRRRTEDAGCCVPRWMTAASLNQLESADFDFQYPLMVKPVDNQSGRGVSRVESRERLATAFDYAKSMTRTGLVLVEQCVDGVEVIVDGFVVNGAPIVLAVAEKTPYDDNRTIAARITYSGRHTAMEVEKIERENARTIRALGLANGPFHAEYILSGTAVVPIDIAARGGGVMIYTHVIPHVTGVDVNRAAIDCALGNPVGISPVPGQRAANVEFFRLPEGEVVRIDGAEMAAKLPGIIGVHVRAAPGDIIGPLRYKDDRAGYVIGTGTTAEEAIASAAAAKATMRAVMQGSDLPIPLI